MLILSRKVGERIVIGDNITVVINRISGNRVSIGVDAPNDVKIIRGELKRIVEEFEERYYDTEIFFDPYAGGKFANYLFAAHKNVAKQHTAESAHHLIEEAQLFIEAVHSCYNRMGSEEVAASK